jgi:hypothetical protein
MPRPARTSLESGGGRGSSNVKGDTMKILTINGFRRVVDMPDTDAVFNASGARVRTLALTPERVKAALKA